MKDRIKSMSHGITGMERVNILYFSGVPRNFVRGGSTNSVYDRENRDLGPVAP
jgi:hypothetical protein